MRIGIFGGTFDPCHIGHAAIVKEVLRRDLVDHVAVLPTAISAYRAEKAGLFTYAERLAILHAMFDGMNDVSIDASEYEWAKCPDSMPARRYADTLKELTGRKPYAGNMLFTIVGGDQYSSFKTWHRWQEVLKLSKLIAVGRNGLEVQKMPDVPCIEAYISNEFADISATKFRTLLAEKKDAFTAYLKMIGR